jgi:hypothetical protein
MTRLRGALAPPTPLARVAVLRAVIAAFVVWDCFFNLDNVIPHATGPQNLYNPLLLRRVLHLPTPDPFSVHALLAVVVAAAVVVASGRLPRAAGYLLAAAFTDWASIAYSYSKIDHDHFALVVTLWVLPTVGAARFGDRRRSEAAGWALVCVQVACVATYFLSFWAKMRFGGWDWADGSVTAWAIVRRGTDLAQPLLQHPHLLVASQWFVLACELASPLLLLPRYRRRWVAVLGFCLFHLTTWLIMEIHFLPLVVCLLAFLPVERAWARAARAASPRSSRASSPAVADAA